MKTIRFKVKHLLLILFIGITLVLFGESIFWNGITFYNNNVSNENRINIEAMSTSSILSENKRLDLLLSEQNYSFYDLVNISDGAMTSSAHIRKESSDKIYDQYLLFAGDHDILADYPDYYLNVILTQWFGGNIERTMLMLEAAAGSELTGDTKDHYHMIRLSVAMTYHDVDAILSELDSIQTDDFEPTRAAILSFVGMFLDSSVTYELPEQREYTGDDRYIGYFSYIYWTINDFVHFRLDNYAIDENQTIKGQVTLNGEPFSGLFIYEDVSRGMSTGEGFEKRLFVPDSEGHYEINGIYTPTFSLGILVPWQIIHDKQYLNNLKLSKTATQHQIDITFDDGVRFDQLTLEDGKLHYSVHDVNAGPDRSYRLRVRYVDPSYSANGGYTNVLIPSDSLQGTLSLEDLRLEMRAPYMNVSGPATYERLMEPLYLTDDYYFELHPIAEDTLPYVSNGLFSDDLSYALHVKGQDEPSEGDLLIQEGNVEAAIKWYEENLNIHSLKVLSALYSRGYIEVEGVDFQPWELGGTDREKAVYYTRLLIDSGVSDYSTLWRLADLYKDLGDYDNEYEILKKTLEVDPSKYIQISIGRNMINREDYTGGLEHMTAYCEPLQDADRYLHYVFIGNRQDLLPDAYLTLFEDHNLSLYDSMFSLVNAGQYQYAWENLTAQDNSDLKTFYELMFLESFDTDEINYEKQMIDFEPTYETENPDHIDYYVDRTKGLKDQALKKILEMMKEDNNWFTGR